LKLPIYSKLANDPLVRQMFRYLLVGGINTIVGFGIYSFFIFLGANFMIAAFVSQIIGMIFNYFSYGKVVFKEKLNIETLIKYAIVYTVLYLISITVLFLLQKLGLNAYGAGLCNLFLSIVLSFILNRTLVFNKAKV